MFETFLRRTRTADPAVKALQDETERLRAELHELRSAHDALKRSLGGSQDWGSPSFDADYTRLWFRNVDFLDDPVFMAAYRAGMASNHGLGATPTQVDIHIEWRILVCCWAAWHAKRLPGAFVECGTNTGIMSLSICNYLQWNGLDRSFFLFDTFDGIPENQIGSDEEHAHAQNKYYRNCYEIAQANFAAFDRIHLVRGPVPDTLDSVTIPEVCYLMIDMNVVLPEKAALAHFWDRMTPGGIVLFDDYGWSGYHLQKQAHDAFAAERGYKILNLPTGQGLLIK